MANIQARITPQGNVVKGKLNPQKNISVTEYRVDTQNIRLTDLFDVDTSQASDGALLVFSGETGNFKATTELKNENTQVNGGHY